MHAGMYTCTNTKTFIQEVCNNSCNQDLRRRNEKEWGREEFEEVTVKNPPKIIQDTSNHRCVNLREHQAEGIKNPHTYIHYSPNAENQNEHLEGSKRKKKDYVQRNKHQNYSRCLKKLCKLEKNKATSLK